MIAAAEMFTIYKGNRIQLKTEFGFITLDITGLIAEDSGEYVCVARSKTGEAQSVGRLICLTKVEIVPPSFDTELLEAVHDVCEGDNVHMECHVVPPNAQIEWYFNDAVLTFGHRFKIVQDFGYIAMDLLYAYAEGRRRSHKEKGFVRKECFLRYWNLHL